MAGLQILQALHTLLGEHIKQQQPQASKPQQSPGYTPAQQAQMTPVGQPIPQGMMDSFSPQTRALAQIYQQNPSDPRVMHLDPKMFGYRPDNQPNMQMPQAGSQMQRASGLRTLQNLR